MQDICRKLVGEMLLAASGLMLFSSVMYIVDDSNEKWFSRAALGFILMGLWFAGSKDKE